MRVLVCGDRNWSDVELLNRSLDTFHKELKISCVIEGEATGADTLARTWAQQTGVLVESYPANWAQYGRAAGPIRNKQMLEDGNPDYVIAFHNNITQSRGTRNMLNQALKHKGILEVILVSSSGVDQWQG